MARAQLARRIIGRDDEVQTLRSLFDRATSGETQLALVAGPAGVGKSSLLTEFVAGIDGRALIGSCLPLGERGVPFAPVIEMLRTLDPDLTQRDELLTALAGGRANSTEAPISETASRTHLFQALLDLVAGLSHATATVIVVEDLHWADRSTRDLLGFLLPNLRTERLLLVASYRTDDIHRDHPLRPMLAELHRNQRVTHLDVPPFSADLVAEQITNLTGRAPSAHSLAEVMRRTQGNPYFVEALVAADDVDPGALPASLRELLLVRADVVSTAARRTLRILAVAEGHVADDALARVAGTAVDAVREHLREAIDTRLLVATATGTTFAHALLREALYEDLLPGERASYHAAFAEVLVSGLEPDAGHLAGRLAQLAHHHSMAGDVDAALPVWSAAATAAESIFAFAEAHHHLAQIVANWQHVSNPADVGAVDHADLLARTAELAFLGGDADEASRLVRVALELVDPDIEPRRAGVLHERLARFVRDTEEHDQALALVERAQELVPADPPSADHARVLAGVAGQLMTRGRYAEARDVAQRAVDEARIAGSIIAQADALNTLGVLATVIDDVEVGVSTMRAALDLAKRCGDAHQQMRSYWNTMACLTDAGEWERAHEAFRDAMEQLPRLGQSHLLPELYVIEADLLMVLGRWDEAAATIEEANRRFPGTDDLLLVDLLTERGEFGLARSAIESKTARNVFIDQEQEGWPLVHLAMLETWEGHVEPARQAVDAALAITADLAGPIATAYALATGCRCEADAAVRARQRHDLDEERRSVVRCRALTDRIDDLLSRPGPANGWKREVSALAAQCRAELARAEGNPDPDAWAVATARWDPLPTPYRAAYTRFRTAEALFTESGDRTVTGSLLADAHRVVAELGARPLREMIEAFARRARIDIGVGAGTQDDHGLTAREREVLATLSTGATNRQIAAMLFISEKTASVHVSNIIRKMGVSNRGEAVAVAHREGLAS